MQCARTLWEAGRARVPSGRATPLTELHAQVGDRAYRQCAISMPRLTTWQYKKTIASLQMQ